MFNLFFVRLVTEGYAFISIIIVAIIVIIIIIIIIIIYFAVLVKLTQ